MFNRIHAVESVLEVDAVRHNSVVGHQQRIEVLHERPQPVAQFGRPRRSIFG